MKRFLIFIVLFAMSPVFGLIALWVWHRGDRRFRALVGPLRRREQITGRYRLKGNK